MFKGDYENMALNNNPQRHLRNAVKQRVPGCIWVKYKCGHPVHIEDFERFDLPNYDDWLPLDMINPCDNMQAFADNLCASIVYAYLPKQKTKIILRLQKC